MINVIRSLFVAFFLVPLLFFVSSVQANHIPAPTGYINDYAEVLTSEQKTTLENSLKEYEQKSTNEITVAIVKGLSGGEIDDFTVRAFEEWKIGKKGQDNGLLLLAAIEDRKMRIEIGYGLEPYLTDSQAGEIIRNVIAPEFKKGNYNQGIIDGVEKIKFNIDTATSGGDPSSFSGGLKDSSGIYQQFIKPYAFIASIITAILLFLSLFVRNKLPFNIKTSFLGKILLNKNLTWYGFLVILLFILVAAPVQALGIIAPIIAEFAGLVLLAGIVYFASFLGRTSHFWLGGVLGGILGGGLGLIFGTIIDATIWAVILGILGLILDFILSANYRVRKQTGKPTDFWHSWGGLSSGGFGGFGGGSSGGGGASGDW